MTSTALRRSGCHVLKRSHLCFPYAAKAHENISNFEDHTPHIPGAESDLSSQLSHFAPGLFKVSGSKVTIDHGIHRSVASSSGVLFGDIAGNGIQANGLLRATSDVACTYGIKTCWSSHLSSPAESGILGEEWLKKCQLQRNVKAPLPILNELLENWDLLSGRLDNSPLEASSVKKKRRLKMNKHKHRKLRRRERHRNK